MLNNLKTKLLSLNLKNSLEISNTKKQIKINIQKPKVVLPKFNYKYIIYFKMYFNFFFIYNL